MDITRIRGLQSALLSYKGEDIEVANKLLDSQMFH